LNTNEYISSGILEAYVFGELNQEEVREVENMAAQYPDVMNEIKSIRDSFEDYALSHAVTPPAHLKNKILAAIQEQEKESPKPIAETRPIAEVKEEVKIIPIQAKNSYLKYLVAASVSATLVTSGLSVHYHGKWKAAEASLVALNKDNQILANQVNFKSSELETTQKFTAFLQDTSTTLVAMKGLPLAPDAYAKVFWNKNQKEVYLKVENLAAAPTDKQYQLWALKDGVPIDAGVFDVNGVLQKMKDIEGAQAFAVTLEPKGGSPTPHLETLCMMGAI
jgi:anti-sigma-K factor RskA